MKDFLLILCFFYVMWRPLIFIIAIIWYLLEYLLQRLLRLIDTDKVKKLNEPLGGRLEKFKNAIDLNMARMALSDNDSNDNDHDNDDNDNDADYDDDFDFDFDD
ncbi:MAG: hypothetical protein IJM54_05085 [Thermoguttaceae bacterium]|nr:hypothetical protein [Thermoguttaceae bacterium]MBR4750936.1 hypothetical protein [Thermoguttaceae bacterium]MBR5759157.1 hypothetical protein [Thermoguttaceae bacterium]